MNIYICLGILALYRYRYIMFFQPPPEVTDKRYCAFCNKCGDGDTHTVARLLNVDVDRWVHLNCALWSAEVYETQVCFISSYFLFVAI